MGSRELVAPWMWLAGVLSVSNPARAQVVADIVHAFPAPGAVAPQGSLIRASDGNFYGVTRRGGFDDCGTIFGMTPAGSTAVIHHFSGPDGCHPGFALVQAHDGALYGMAPILDEFGQVRAGVAFRTTLDGGFAVIHTFTGAPQIPLVEGADGNLYGAVTTLFRMDLSGQVDNLQEFPGGAVTTLMAAPDGNMYGVRAAYMPGDGSITYSLFAASRRRG